MPPKKNKTETVTPPKKTNAEVAAAKKEVQKILTQVEGLLEEAGKLMDDHQFSTNFQGRTYFPRNLELVPYDYDYIEPDDIDSDDDGYQLMRPKSLDENLEGLYFYKDSYPDLAGEWKSSSEWREC